jgi:hypothetical protein
MGGPSEWGKPLRRFVDFETKNGKFKTLMEYHPANGSLLIPLNHDIPTIYGDVDVDWMLRVAWASDNEFAGWLLYRTAKFYWNVIDPRQTGGWDARLSNRSIVQSANEMAPYVAHKWIGEGKTLRDIFAPALAKCK